MRRGPFTPASDQAARRPLPAKPPRLGDAATHAARACRPRGPGSATKPSCPRISSWPVTAVGGHDLDARSWSNRPRSPQTRVVVRVAIISRLSSSRCPPPQDPVSRDRWPCSRLGREPRLTVTRPARCWGQLGGMRWMSVTDFDFGTKLPLLQVVASVLARRVPRFLPTMAPRLVSPTVMCQAAERVGKLIGDAAPRVRRRHIRGRGLRVDGGQDGSRFRARGCAGQRCRHRRAAGADRRVLARRLGRRDRREPQRCLLRHAGRDPRHAHERRRINRQWASFLGSVGFAQAAAYTDTKTKAGCTAREAGEPRIPAYHLGAARRCADAPGRDDAPSAAWMRGSPQTSTFCTGRRGEAGAGGPYPSRSKAWATMRPSRGSAKRSRSSGIPSGCVIGGSRQARYRRGQQHPFQRLPGLQSLLRRVTGGEQHHAGRLALEVLLLPARDRVIQSNVAQPTTAAPSHAGAARPPGRGSPASALPSPEPPQGRAQ